MVKQINLFLDDKDHKIVMKAKGNMTWKEFFLKFSESMIEEKRVEEKKQDKRKRNDEKSN